MISTLFTLFKMTRPVNIVIAVITLVVGYILLQHNPTTPVLILQMLGFATADYFTAEFRKRTGRRPSELRKMQK